MVYVLAVEYSLVVLMIFGNRNAWIGVAVVPKLHDKRIKLMMTILVLWSMTMINGNEVRDALA